MRGAPEQGQRGTEAHRRDPPRRTGTLRQDRVHQEVPRSRSQEPQHPHRERRGQLARQHQEDDLQAGG